MANNSSNSTPAPNARKPGRNARHAHDCWYCGHTGGDPVKTAQMKANGNFLLGIIATLLGILAFKVK